MIEKIFKFLLGTICYFLIVFILFWLTRYFGINKDSSPTSLAIGATAGWLIF